MIDVSQTFRKQGILLTGANGFVGKVILGLLVDRYPEFQHLFVLGRPKGTLSASERFERDVLGSPALGPVVDKFGRDWFKQKVTVLSGDVAEPDYGLGPDALDGLGGQVGAVLNCAGLVDFYAPVDAAFRANVDGARNSLALARRLGARLAHISTCFVCGEADGLIEESQPIAGFYPNRKGPGDGAFHHEDEIAYMRERIRQILEPEEGRPSKAATRRLVDLGRQRAEHWGWTNTYTYSKSLGEQIVAAEEDVPWTIIRPAIVEGAERFPFPGWIEGGRTSAPLVLMAMSGMKDWPVRRDAPLEVVPVDMIAAATLAATALLLNGCHEPVYQLGTADINPILLEPLVEMLAGEVEFVSPEEAKARRNTLQKRLAMAQTFLSDVRRKVEATGLPSGPLASLSITLRSRGLQAALREQTLDQYLPFILHNRYVFESENIRAAYALLSEADRRLLPWDPETIDWEDYWLNKQVKGIEKWIQPEAVKEWAFKI